MADNNTKKELTDAEILAYFDTVRADFPAKEVDHVQKILDGIAEQREKVETAIKENKIFSFGKFDWVTFVQAKTYRVKIGHFPVEIKGETSRRVDGIEKVLEYLDFAKLYIERDLNGVQAMITKQAEERSKKIAQNKTKKSK